VANIVTEINTVIKNKYVTCDRQAVM